MGGEVFCLQEVRGLRHARQLPAGRRGLARCMGRAGGRAALVLVLVLVLQCSLAEAWPSAVLSLHMARFAPPAPRRTAAHGNPVSLLEPRLRDADVQLHGGARA